MNAITYAMELFENMPCEFVLLNIQKPSQFLTHEIITANPEQSLFDAISRDNMKQLRELRTKLEGEYAGRPFKFDILFDFNSLEDAIQQLVNKRNIELVIMGSNGATDADQVVFGSNTLRVIRHVNCPILVIPEGFKFNRLQHLLFTLREEEHFHPDAIKPLSDVLRDHTIQLHFLQIDTHRKLPESAILNNFKGITTYHIEGIPVNYAISSFEQLIPVDMHAIYIQPKSFFERIFSETDTAKISYVSRVPLFVLK